ncbi:unnamed protein product [Rhizopus stolonifer]
MALSSKNQKSRSNSDEFNGKRNKLSWTQVVSKNIVSVHRAHWIQFFTSPSSITPPIAAHKRISIQTRPISARREPIQQQHSVTQITNTAPAAENRAPSKAIDERPNKHTPVDRPTLSVVEAQSSRSEGPAHIAKKAQHNIDQSTDTALTSPLGSFGDNRILKNPEDFVEEMDRSDTESVNHSMNHLMDTQPTLNSLKIETLQSPLSKSPLSIAEVYINNIKL